MIIDNLSLTEQDEALEITDKAYQLLYVPELQDHPDLEKGGACLLNAYRVVEHLLVQGVPEERLQFLYIAALAPGGNHAMKPNMETLRQEEQSKALRKGKSTEWGFHAAVITRDTHQVFDLSSDKSNWGMKLDQYMATTFGKENKGPDPYIRAIVTPLNSLAQLVETHQPVSATKMIQDGEANDGGMTTMWVLENKPEEEWFATPS